MGFIYSTATEETVASPCEYHDSPSTQSPPYDFETAPPSRLQIETAEIEHSFRRNMCAEKCLARRSRAAMYSRVETECPRSRCSHHTGYTDPNNAAPSDPSSS